MSLSLTDVVKEKGTGWRLLVSASGGGGGGGCSVSVGEEKRE